MTDQTATPLLDSFMQGLAPRDVRLLAAQGALAPRAYEQQLEILALLLADSDPEIRRAADTTVNRIPIDALQAFLGQSVVSARVLECFANRGVFPAERPAIEVDVDKPLIDAAPLEFVEDEVEQTEADRESVMQKLSKMSFPERLKAAMKGTKEMRAILIRDPNKMISAAVLSSPKVSQAEAAVFARMASLSEDVLQAIGSNRAWMKSYAWWSAWRETQKRRWRCP